MRKINAYTLPKSGLARELLRQTGQFWTPEWVAEAMVEYVLAEKSSSLFDPAIGTGVFLKAAKDFARENAYTIRLAGYEIDDQVLQQARHNELCGDDLANVLIRDFVLQPSSNKLPAIVANPPYIRHHRITQKTKDQLKALAAQALGAPLDGRAGLHVYFLLRALLCLEAGGRLAFIMPADTCEGVFAPQLWKWITQHYRLDCVITFDPIASPFPGVDTNPLVFFIQNQPSNGNFVWACCHELGFKGLKTWVREGWRPIQQGELTAQVRSLDEGLQTGLSRPPADIGNDVFRLGQFARVMRGVATGANDFFFLTKKQVRALKIPRRYLVTAIGRTRDVLGSEITAESIKALQTKGRPTVLLHLNGEPIRELPHSVQVYLAKGEAQGLPSRPLIAQRRIWYKMETRSAPPILFAYLGRRNARFIRNWARVIPLTGFLCIYPLIEEPGFVDKLWQVLSHPDTVANLRLIGKSYGSGAIKVEPRALEKLPLPVHVVERAGLQQLQKRLL